MDLVFRKINLILFDREKESVNGVPVRKAGYAVREKEREAAQKEGRTKHFNETEGKYV